MNILWIEDESNPIEKIWIEDNTFQKEPNQEKYGEPKKETKLNWLTIGSKFEEQISPKFLKIYKPDEDNVFLFNPRNFTQLDTELQKVVEFYDYFIIDINLENHGDLHLFFKQRHKQIYSPDLSDKDTPPEGFEKSINDFKKKAGFVVFHFLIEQGIPSDRIAFYTANANNSDDSYNKTIGIFKDAMLPRPSEANLFHKLKKEPTNQKEQTEISYQKIKKWITDNKSFKYLTFRRHVIETCNHVLADPSEFNLNIFGDKNNYNEYFERLKRILPLQINSEGESELYKYFLREMSSPFDKIDLKDFEGNDNKKSDAKYYVETSKIIRNWLAHGKVDGKIKLNHVIFLSNIIFYAVRNQFAKMYFHSDKSLVLNTQIIQDDISKEVVKFTRELIPKVLNKKGMLSFKFNSMLQILVNIQNVSANYFYKSYLSHFYPSKVIPIENKSLKKNPKKNSEHGVIYLNIVPSEFNYENMQDFEKKLLLFSVNEIEKFEKNFTKIS